MSRRTGRGKKAAGPRYGRPLPRAVTDPGFYAFCVAGGHHPTGDANFAQAGSAAGRVGGLTGRLPESAMISMALRGRHFLQEDSPDEIGHALAEFVRRARS